MADRPPDLSADAIAILVREIGELRRTAEGTLIDQAKLKTRYDDATTGILSNDRFDREAWKALTEPQQTAIEAKLSSLKRDLLGPWPGTDGPEDPRSFMHKDYASNSAIMVLTLVAILGLLLDLGLICHEWEAATAGTRRILDFTTESESATTAKAIATAQLPRPSPGPKEGADLTSSPTPPAVDAVTTAASPIPPSSSATTISEPKKPGDIPGKVTEQAVLWMVILMGALGGFLHVASSMANFVGARQLLKSWIIYYLLIPFQGAALAPVIYLLLRVGVLNPAGTTKSGTPTESLNLIGIYAFAALTGLFSKKAIEMLAAVFETVFKKADTTDSLEKPKSDAGKSGK
ncbi:MAG: hypothetical protein DMF06_08995 [Verrucomicrobia bacterium]|nr:MAG: hypothetical protein DMF06_08995 [Verrucomicrobiota bacterium]